MSKIDDACYGSPIRPWMGRYPRKGADWSPEEDQALIREHESGRYLIKQIAARHLREPAAIERRLDLLHARSTARLSVLREGNKAAPKVNQERDWQVEQEKAQRALDEIRRLFADFMRSQPRSTELTRLSVPPWEKAAAPGDILMYGGEPYCVLRVEQGAYGSCIITVERCSNFPPEIAQALQFGTGS